VSVTVITIINVSKLLHRNFSVTIHWVPNLCYIREYCQQNYTVLSSMLTGGLKYPFFSYPIRLSSAITMSWYSYWTVSTSAMQIELWSCWLCMTSET
jgi:hypothetical protein